MPLILKAFLADKSGATAIEYAIIAGGVSTAIIATVYSIGPKLNSTFSSVSTQLKWLVLAATRAGTNPLRAFCARRRCREISLNAACGS